jgi:hypothetical protein
MTKTTVGEINQKMESRLATVTGHMMHTRLLAHHVLLPLANLSSQLFALSSGLPRPIVNHTVIDLMI